MSATAPSRFCPICETHSDAEVCPTDQVPTVRADFDHADLGDAVIGSVVAGRFRVERLLGQGGAGRVYAAVQLSVARPVALKLLQPHHAKDRVHVRRFYREARAATRLAGAHVVRIIDFGVDDDTRTPFIAMELLDGETLRQLIARLGPQPARVAARLGAQIAQALVEAAEAGIVHRDLKPANIMCVPQRDGESLLKVMDFGVAKQLGQGDTDTLTAQGAAVGTPAYMAPEQVSGGEIEARTDLYALGCILFELVTGRTPFTGDARAELYVDHLLKPAPAVPARVADQVMPAALVRLVAQLLEKSPADRPAGARTVAQQLEAIAASAQRAPRGVLGIALATLAVGAMVIGAAVWATTPQDRPEPPAQLAAGVTASRIIEHLVVRGAAATIRLNQGEPRPAVIAGDEQRVAMEQDGARLTITIGPPRDEPPSGSGAATHASGAPLVIDLWSPAWKTLKVTGAATLTSASALTATDLSLALAGLARADLELSGSGLTTSIRGSSEATLRGRVEHHEVRSGGASRLDARALITEETSLVAGGTSDATVLAQSHLDLRNEGTGELSYLGKPADLTTDGPGINQLDR